MSKTIIVIPARYGSTRFPGKPLYKIAGKTLLQHVCEAAKQAIQHINDAKILVATDDERILQHATELNVDGLITPETCETGTDRVIAAIKQLDQQPEYILNLQGDAPLTPATILISLLHTLQTSDIVTPVMQLNWEYLDILRNAKLITPFSGTTAIINNKNQAVWFSKQIIPAIRNETKLRMQSPLSPVFQHLGIYGYTYKKLETFASLPVGHYEKLEGLEQLRFLENGYPIHAVNITLDNMHAWRGVDTPEDAEFVEQILLTGNEKI